MTIVTRVEKATVVSIIHDDPVFARLFIAHLISRVVRIEDDFVDQLFNSSEKRLARTLLSLARFGTPSKPHSAVLKVSQGTLAEMIGTTRSRVSFLMNRFPQAGTHRLQRNRASTQGSSSLSCSTNHLHTQAHS